MALAPCWAYISLGKSVALQIAALAFGITLGNIDVLGPPIMRNAISRKPISLNDNERAFFSEAVFLLRTFFFVYIGISVRLQDWHWMMLGAAITGFLFLVRIPVVRISVPRSTSPKDASYMATMIPKGLGAAVLASLPAQQGVAGGEIIQSVVFSIILCSTVFTTILTFLVEKTVLSSIYTWIFRILGLGKASKTLPEISVGLPRAPARPCLVRCALPPTAMRRHQSRRH